MLRNGLIVLVLAVELSLITAKEPKCGFPGTPAYGYGKPDANAYSEGEIVKYSCRVGYILLGKSITRCLENGSWSEEVPICDDSMTTLGVAFSTPTVPGNSAELAIDRNKDTCSYLKPKKPRWWRIDLGEEHNVLSVAVTMNDLEKNVKFTVFVIKTHGTDASYKRCSSFSGKFGTPTVILSCAEGKGIEGQKVHIEDHNPSEEFFEICEVEVQVEKDTGYDCGKPSKSLHSTITEQNDDSVEYSCMTGYKRKGKDFRLCQNNGQWSGDPPVCEAIICDELEPLENGDIDITDYDGDDDDDDDNDSNADDGEEDDDDDNDPPLAGSVASYKCDYGYRLSGITTRNCLNDGTWSGKTPQCKAIRCPVPDGKDVNGVYRLVNQTNSMGSLALLRCKGGKMDGDNPYIECLETGDWSEPEAHCLLPARALLDQREAPRIANKGAVIFGMVVAAIMIVVVLVILYLYSQRGNGPKPELPSRNLELVPPPRPPPRHKSEAIKSAFMGVICGGGADGESADDQESVWKSNSLPRDKFRKGENMDGVLPSGKDPDGPAVVEVEVLAGNESPLRNDVILEVDENDNDSAPSKQHPEDAYAAVNYEKKRESRLLKDSEESPAPSPTPDAKESSPPPTPPKHEASEEEEEESSEEENSQIERDARLKAEEERKAKEEEDRKAKEEEERKAKEEEERKAKEEEERKAKEEEDKKPKEEAPGRRRRVREPQPVEDEKPVMRRFRRY